MNSKIQKFLTKYFIANLIMLFLLFTLFYYKNIANQKNALTEKNGINEFPKISLKNQFGELKTINDYKGKIILIDFWFAGCPSCLREMKYFPKLLQKYHDKLVILSYSVDSEEITKKILDFKQKPWDFIISENPNWTFYNVNLREKNNLKNFLKIESFPAHFIINEKGKFIDSPKNIIYGVESKLSGFLSMNLTIDKIEKDYKEIFFKYFLLFNIGVLLILIIQLIIKKIIN